MAQVNAGRVRFIGRGEYDNSTQYYTFDLVNYNGNSYFAKSNTMGNLPTNSTYWQLVAEKGNIGPAGPTGNGIDHISLTSQSGATKVYTIYFTDGNTTTFTVEDGEVTQEVFDEEVERLNMIYNAMPKVSGEGTDLTLNNTAECPIYDIELSPSELEQATTSISEGDEYDSPSPEHPQEIHTVSGDNTVVVGNKNLLNRATCVENYGLTWQYGVEWPEAGALSTDYIKAKSGDTFSSDYFMIIFFYKKDKTYLGFLQNNIITKTGSGTPLKLFTVPESNEVYYVRIAYRKGYNQNVDMTTVNIMLNKGTTLLDYVSHKKQTYPLSLGDLEYCKIGDYEDLFFKNVVGSEYYDSTLELDKWYLKKNIGKTTDTIGSTSKTISDMINNATVYSYCGGTVSGTTITYTSALVVANYIYYPTTTPTYTLLSDTLQTQLDNIHKAISYQDQTNVSQENNDLPFVIKLSAIRDLSGIFEEI